MSDNARESIGCWSSGSNMYLWPITYAYLLCQGQKATKRKVIVATGHHPAKTP